MTMQSRSAELLTNLAKFSAVIARIDSAADYKGTIIPGTAGIVDQINGASKGLRNAFEEQLAEFKRIVPTSEIFDPNRVAFKAQKQHAPFHIPFLISLLKDDQPDIIRKNSIEILGVFGKEASGAVPELMRILHQSDHEYLQEMVIKILGDIGPSAKAVVPMLMEIINTHNTFGNLFHDSAIAVSKIAPDMNDYVIPLLIQAIRERGCATSASTLGHMGAAAASTVFTLTEAIKANNYSLSSSAVEALGKIGPSAASAVPVLIKSLKGKYHTIPDLQVMETLGKIGPKASAAIPILIDIEKFGNYNRSRAAKLALEKIKSAIPAETPKTKGRHLQRVISIVRFALGLK